eukprot:2907839-Alexandrium_andersonii.AAC.1
MAGCLFCLTVLLHRKRVQTLIKRQLQRVAKEKVEISFDPLPPEPRLSLSLSGSLLGIAPVAMHAACDSPIRHRFRITGLATLRLAVATQIWHCGLGLLRRVASSVRSNSSGSNSEWRAARQPRRFAQPIALRFRGQESLLARPVACDLGGPCRGACSTKRTFCCESLAAVRKSLRVVASRWRRAFGFGQLRTCLSACWQPAWPTTRAQSASPAGRSCGDGCSPSSVASARKGRSSTTAVS